MRVSELIELLKQQDSNDEVLVADEADNLSSHVKRVYNDGMDEVYIAVKGEWS